jgi:hypothetical protein
MNLYRALSTPMSRILPGITERFHRNLFFYVDLFPGEVLCYSRIEFKRGDAETRDFFDGELVYANWIGR